MVIAPGTDHNSLLLLCHRNIRKFYVVLKQDPDRDQLIPTALTK